jgi:hypothetical protein
MSKNTGFKTEAGKDIHVDDLLFSAVLRKVGRVLEYRSTYIVAFFQKGQGIKYFDIEKCLHLKHVGDFHSNHNGWV